MGKSANRAMIRLTRIRKIRGMAMDRCVLCPAAARPADTVPPSPPLAVAAEAAAAIRVRGYGKTLGSMAGKSMKTLDEIKALMSAGETAQADVALKELLAQEPDNLQAKMLYGTCRQLLGDEETFRRIHGELAPEMEKLADDPLTVDTIVPAETLSLWKKYHALWMTLIIGGLVLAGGVYVLGMRINQGFSASAAAMAAYRGPPREELGKLSPEGISISNECQKTGNKRFSDIVNKRFEDEAAKP